MVACPHCGATAMTLWQKLKTGPRHAIHCRSCSQQVSVSATGTMLAVVGPIAAGGMIAHFSTSLALGAIAILAGGVAAIALYLFSVPVTRR